jgi:hypothetical protein
MDTKEKWNIYKAGLWGGLLGAAYMFFLECYPFLWLGLRYYLLVGYYLAVGALGGAILFATIAAVRNRIRGF